MATRPVGNPPIWAQTTSFPAGADPWSGNATKVTAPSAETVGFTPETGIVAEYANDEFNVLSTWVEWLSFGSSAAGEDAHVVETDSAGKASLAGVLVGGTAAAFPALFVSANSGASAAAATFSNTLGGFALAASSDGASAAVRGVSTGAEPGILGINSGGGGAGLQGTGDGAGAGVIGSGGATGEGGTFTGGATSGSGVSGTAIGSFFGVAGISAASASGAGGVSGTATRNDSAGVIGFALVAGADPLVESTAAVVGLALDASGVYGKSTNGYGVWAESSGVVRASLHIEPQASDPISPLEGDVWYNSAEDHLKGRIDGTSMGLWATRRGYLYSYIEQVGQISSAAQTFQTIITGTFTAQAEPIGGAIATFNVIFEMGCSVIALNGAEEFEWQVLDVTDGAATPIAARLEVSHVASAVNADERYVTAQAQYTIPSSGARTFELQVRSITPAPVFRIRRAVMEITGSHG